MKTVFKMFCVFLLHHFSAQAIRPIISFQGQSIKRMIMKLITHEQQCIKVAMYMFTDKEIAQKLIDARKRGVRVESIVDSCTIRNSAQIAKKLREADIPVMHRKALPCHSCMHLKCWIFRSTRLDNRYGYSPCVATGSSNATYNAVHHNDEMMAFLFGKQSFDKCNQSFKRIKKDSEYISKK